MEKSKDLKIQSSVAYYTYSNNNKTTNNNEINSDNNNTSNIFFNNYNINSNTNINFISFYPVICPLIFYPYNQPIEQKNSRFYLASGGFYTMLIHNENDYIESLRFYSSNFSKEDFDDMLYDELVKYDRLNKLDLFYLNIAKNLKNIRSLFRVNEPETIILNKDNISYFTTPVLAKYDQYNTKKIILNNIFNNYKNGKSKKSKKIIEVNKDFYNIFVILSYNLKYLYKSQNREKELDEKISNLIKDYEYKNNDLLKNLHKYIKFEITEKDNIKEYGFYYTMNLQNNLTLKIKLSSVKLKELANKNIQIIYFKTEKIFRKKGLATNLLTNILNKYKNYRFVTLLTDNDGYSLLHKLGFVRLTEIKDTCSNKNHYIDYYCKKLHISRYSYDIKNKIEILNPNINNIYLLKK